MPNGFEIISAFLILVNHGFGESDFRCAYGATEIQYILVSNSVFFVLFHEFTFFALLIWYEILHVTQRRTGDATLRWTRLQ